ncbi:bifunctional UDP-sugar hydrolase/5'-nucleotidase [Spirochaetota bacterium]
MKRFVLVLAIIAAVFAISCVSEPAVSSKTEPAGEVQIAILHVNDTHGHPLPFSDSKGKEVGGLPAMSNLVGQTRAQFKNVLVLDAGDYNTGMTESNFFKAEPDITGRNMIGFDAVTLGNHEFDNELSVLEAQKAKAEFPLLSANAVTKDGKYIADKPYIIKEFQGVKVGIFGLTTAETAIIGNPSIVKDLVFRNEIEVAKEMVKVLREQEKVNVVIALVHLGLDPTNIPGAKGVAEAVSGIDLIIDGHSHTFVQEPLVINGTPIVQSFQWGIYVGKGVLTVKEGAVSNFSWEPVPMNFAGADGKPLDPQFEQDPAIRSALMVYRNKVEDMLKEKIGSAAALFPNAKSRLEETAIGDFVADGMKSYPAAQGVDFAIANGGGIRADLPAGDVTIKSIFTILPFDNYLVILKMKGSDLSGLFDFIPSLIGKGAYAQVSDGVSYTINTKTGKCENVLIGGQPIDPDKVYTIATNDYMAGGGDGYVIFRKALSVYNTSAYLRDVVTDYVKRLGKPLAPEIKGRVKIIN